MGNQRWLILRRTIKLQLPEKVKRKGGAGTMGKNVARKGNCMYQCPELREQMVHKVQGTPNIHLLT